MINRMLIGAVLAVSVVVGAFFYGHSHGVDSATLEHQQMVEELRTESFKSANALEAEKKRIKVETVERVETIYVKEDPTGCSDVSAPEWMLQTIRGDSDRSKADD